MTDVITGPAPPLRVRDGPGMDRRFLTSSEAAEYLQTTRKNLYHLIQRGLPHRKMGKKLLFFQHELDAWLDQLPGRRLSPPVDTLQDNAPPAPRVYAPRHWPQEIHKPLIRQPRKPKPPKIPCDDAPKHRKGADR